MAFWRRYNHSWQCCSVCFEAPIIGSEAPSVWGLNQAGRRTAARILARSQVIDHSQNTNLYTHSLRLLAFLAIDSQITTWSGTRRRSFERGISQNLHRKVAQASLDIDMGDGRMA